MLGPHRARTGTSLLVLLVAASSIFSLLPGSLVGAPITPLFGSTRGGTAVPNAPVSCDQLVTDATLTDLVSQYYPNGSLLPSENQSEQAVTTVWNSLCPSAPFQQAVASAAGGWFEYTSDMQDKNRTASGNLVGSLFVDFELTWNGSCPTGGMNYPAGVGCQFNYVWQANLTAQSVFGPAVTVTSLRFVFCDTPEANTTAVGSVDGFFPDPGTSPNETVAVQEVQAIWGAICTSTPYYDLAATLDMPQALSFSTWRGGTGLNGTVGESGDLFFEWSLFVGDRPCPSDNGSGASDLTCSFYQSWTADLTLDTYSGPTASNFPVLGGSTAFPEGSGTSANSTWLPMVVGFGALGGVLVVAAAVGIAGRRRP